MVVRFATASRDRIVKGEVPLEERLPAKNYEDML